jgi:hypothetical protein
MRAQKVTTKRVLLAGVARSGTTWIGGVMGNAKGAAIVLEPDQPVTDPAGGLAIARLGRYPVLAIGEAAPDYERMWDLAFAGGWPKNTTTRAVGKAIASLPPTVRNGLMRPAAPFWARMRRPPLAVVVKTVVGGFALEWIAARYRPAVVVTRRNLLSVISSWLELGFTPYLGDSRVRLEENATVRREYLDPYGLQPPSPDASRLETVAWFVGLLAMGVQRAIERNPDWIVVSHEDLCVDPVDKFQRLFERVGLEWTDAARGFLIRSDRPGTGTDTNRVTSQQIDKWRRVLSPRDVEVARAILGRFPLSAESMTGGEALAGARACG